MKSNYLLRAAAAAVIAVALLTTGCSEMLQHIPSYLPKDSGSPTTATEAEASHATTSTTTAKKTTTTTVKAPESLNGQEVVNYAKQFLGTPYVYGGNGMVINALPEEGMVYNPLETLYGEYVFHRIFNNTYGQ